MIKNQGGRSIVNMLRNQDENPGLGVNIRRNVSRIKSLIALSPSKIIPKLEGQYAPDYPLESGVGIQEKLTNKLKTK
jgi:hypothetical protein